MPLPILSTTSETLIRLFHKTERHWTQHVAEQTDLTLGSAYSNPELPDVHDNRMLDASLPAGANLDEALAEVQAHFSSRRARCTNWVLNPSAPPEQTQPLIEWFSSCQARSHREDILHLMRPPNSTAAAPADVKIIPARASYRHVQELGQEQVSRRDPQSAAQGLEAMMLHLDDPHYDALLALKQGKAIAKVGVLAVGEVGRIQPLYVSEPHRGQGMGRVMMSRALEICLRSLFKHVFVSCNSENGPALSLYAKLGFQKIGEMISYYPRP